MIYNKNIKTLKTKIKLHNIQGVAEKSKLFNQLDYFSFKWS